MDWKLEPAGRLLIVDSQVGLELSHVGGIYRKGRVCSQGAEKRSRIQRCRVRVAAFITQDSTGGSRSGTFVGFILQNFNQIGYN
ncbi:hypothetical protein [Paenibacillus dendritiformis]|uniref:hypothetical protein n=1 Tax=Paenibacillus dendritiformis TaxID=130049 RepID=UPI00387E0C13